MNKIVFYTFVSDSYYIPCGTTQLINSFKRFHRDVPLVVFRQETVDQVMDKEKKFLDGNVNWLNAKPIFAKFLTNKYEMVVNIDADTIILGKLDEVFTGDYDIGSVMNFNHFENVSLESVSEEDYLQAGFVASRVPEFWDVWMQRSLKDNWKCKCAENDTLNLTVYENPKWKLKVFDKDKNYYGCKLLGLESECYMEEDKVMCRGEQVLAYHAAKGPGNMPKLSPDKLRSYGFKDDVISFMQFVGNYGTTEIFA